MRKILIAALAAAAAQSASAAERRLTVTDFDRVQVDGPYEVTLTTRQASSAVVSGSSEAIERVSVEVQGRLLRVRRNQSAWGGYPNRSVGPVKITLTTHDLRGLIVTGSGSIKVDRARAPRFDISVAGSGQVTLGTIESDRLLVGVIGAGKITIAGKAKTFRATVQGAGTLDASSLTVEDAEISTDSAGTISLTVKRAAKVTANGAGDVEILGPAACTVKALGAGRVACGD